MNQNLKLHADIHAAALTEDLERLGIEIPKLRIERDDLKTEVIRLRRQTKEIADKLVQQAAYVESQIAQWQTRIDEKKEEFSQTVEKYNNWKVEHGL